MSLRDRGYKPYEGAHTPLAGRWTVVLRHTLRMTAKQAWVLSILIISGFPVLVWAALIFFKAYGFVQSTPDLQGSEGVVDPGQYVFLFLAKWYGVPLQAFLMAMFAGGGAIADDSRNNAFQFYFSRPLSREQYLVGKVLAVVLLVAFVSLVPAVLLAIVRIALSHDGADLTRQLWHLPRALALGTLEALVLGVPVVALSSLSKGRGYAQAAFAGLFLLPWVIGDVFVWMFRSPWPALLSVPAQLESVGAVIFSYHFADGDRPLPCPAAVAVMVVMVVSSIALLRARLATAEVVAG